MEDHSFIFDEGNLCTGDSLLNKSVDGEIRDWIKIVIVSLCII